MEEAYNIETQGGSGTSTYEPRMGKGGGRGPTRILPAPTVVMVTTAHQNASGMDLKKEFSEPASAKYTALENSTTPVHKDLLPHVTIADGGHCYYSPPESIGDRLEERELGAGLGEVDGTRKQNHSCNRNWLTSAHEISSFDHHDSKKRSEFSKLKSFKEQHQQPIISKFSRKRGETYNR
ncbi:hypothetical protein J6590_019032 [Homalodisca vitripennis]|nr:hypothetical protein J6590_095571 [Homalodisca vitripennis]KAG8283435.1 hypothetical protein J6590_019032 [Homalodisca vitripennis]